MASSRQVINSLLTEHFRYTPITLLDDIINTVNELVYRAVTAVEEGLTSAPAASLGFADRAAERAATEAHPASTTTTESVFANDVLYPESRIEIEHGVHQLETLLEATVDKNFDKLEIFVLRSILSVPEELVEWIRLGHYENLDFSAANAPNAPTPQSLHLLRRKLHETRKLNTLLHTEQRRNAALIAQLKSLLHNAPQTSTTTTTQEQRAPLAFLTNTSQPQQQFTAQTQALLPYLPTLRNLLQTLQSRLSIASTTPSQIPGSTSDPAMAATAQHADDRRSYIEQQTRKRLERQGVDVDNGSGGIGSASASTLGGASEKIGADEVRGVESVVDALGLTRNGDEDVSMEG